MPIEKPLPIAEYKGKKPSFKLEDILLHEQETERVNCEFEAIQQFLQAERQYRIPSDLANPLQQMAKWQLVIPTTFDVAQLLFLGRIADDREYIPISEAQATVFIHRGAEGGSWSKPRGRYSITWLELAGIFPDSNGSERILGVFYVCYPHSQDSQVDNVSDEDRSRACATKVHVSIADGEYTRRPTVMDSFMPPLIDIPTRPWVPKPSALITQGMLDYLPESHRKVLNIPTKSTFYLYQMGGRVDQEIDFDQGISLKIEGGKVTVGLVSPLGNRKPWTISVPETLEKS